MQQSQEEEDDPGVQADDLLLEIGSKIFLFHEDDWFDCGKVTKIENDYVYVDFFDWMQRWRVSEITIIIKNYRDMFVPINEGVLITVYSDSV